MLRSFAYAATAAELTRDADVPEDWEERARERFLESYLETRRRDAAAAGRGRDRAPARGLRAREGGLRAALRARQPARLGRNPGRGYRAARCTRPRKRCDASTSAPTRTASSAPTRPRTAASSCARSGPRREAVRVQPMRGVEAELERSSRGPLGGAAAEGAAAARVRARGRVPGRRRRSPSATRTRSCRRSASSTSTSPMQGRHEQLYERLGAHVRELDGVVGTAFAVWAPNARSVSGRRRLQLLGRAPAPDALARRVRDLGAVRARASSEGTKYKFEIRTQDGPPAPEGRPARLPHRGAAGERLGRLGATSTSGATRSGSSARAAADPLARPDLDLRGAPRLVAAQPARGRPPAHVPRARGRARRLRLATSASRTSSCCR